MHKRIVILHMWETGASDYENEHENEMEKSAEECGNHC